MRVRLVFIALLVAFALTPRVGAAGETAALDDEIARVRRELAQIQTERRKVKDETARDRKEFLQYQERTAARVARLKAETDSTRLQIALHGRRNDSLSLLLTGIEARKKQHVLLQEKFRERLIAGCDTLLVTGNALPPMASKSITASIAYLRSELAARSIDNVEAANRLAQIVRDMNETTAGIQIMQGISPVAGLQGTTYRIRVGAVFEAAVDEKASGAALWRGCEPDGAPRWEMIKDPAIAAAILKAVNVREGKTVPALVELPFPAVTQEEGK